MISVIDELVKRHWETVIEYNLIFDNGKGRVFRFPCDKNGKVHNLSNALKANLKMCLNEPERFTRFNEVVQYKTTVMMPGKGKCHCGRMVVLNDDYNGACRCPCGQWYNIFGQKLKNNPEYWEVEYDC